MKMATQQQEKELPTEVQQNAIFRETVTKEQRVFKLYTEYKFNPYKDHCVLAGKPNSKSTDGEEDEEFLRIYKRSLSTPQNRYEFPQTEAHEIGWDPEPLISGTKNDVRLNHPRHHSQITTYMEAYWKQKEQENMQ